MKALLDLLLLLSSLVFFRLFLRVDGSQKLSETRIADVLQILHLGITVPISYKLINRIWTTRLNLILIFLQVLRHSIENIVEWILSLVRLETSLSLLEVGAAQAFGQFCRCGVKRGRGQVYLRVHN